MAIQLTPTRIKGSHYLLIPKDLAQLLEINDQSILVLTIEETSKGQRLVYAIRDQLTGRRSIQRNDNHSDQDQ